MTDETRQVIGSARRSFGFSMGILLIGFVAIVLVLVYRATKEEDGPAQRFTIEQIEVPAGAELISVSPQSTILAVTYRLGGQTMVQLIDGKTGETVREIAILSE